jgi:hypothetical protein
MVVEVCMERSGVWLNSRGVPEDIVVARFVDDPMNLAPELRQDIHAEVLVLKPNAGESAIRPVAIDPTGHQ